MPVSRGAAIRAVLAPLFATALIAFPGSAAEPLVLQLSGAAALPPEIPSTGDVPVNQTACEAFLGVFDPTAPGFCIGIGNAKTAPFCEFGKDCQEQFNGVRKCNLVNLRGGVPSIPDEEGFEEYCGAGCAGGLTALGNVCVYGEGGAVQSARTIGELPKEVPKAGDVPVNQTACEAFLGVYDPTAPGFCIGIGNAKTAPFCEFGKDCQEQFNGVRKCNLVNLRGGVPSIPDEEGFEEYCGSACLHGKVARGNACVAPSPPPPPPPDPPPEIPSVPATVMFSAGVNGTIVARAGSGVIARGGAVEVGGKTVDIVFEAIPNAGYRVDSWTDLGDAACGDEPGGHGGPRRCMVRALNGGDYHVSVDFAAGALPADIPASGDVPARGVGGVLSCLAFGGDFVGNITNDTCQNFAGAGSNCVIEGGAGADCQAGFNAARDCNAGNQAAAMTGAGGSVVCGVPCAAGQVAVGDACQDADAGPFRVFFAPEVNVKAFRIDGTPVASGGYASDNVVLSVVATPAAGSFVAGWSDNCEILEGKFKHDHDNNRRTPAVLAIQGDSPDGDFDDSGAKSCFVRVTMNVHVTADIQAHPPEPPDYPVFDLQKNPWGGYTLEENRANCELFGGTYNGARTRCEKLDDNEGRCLHENRFGDATCGAYFNTMRTCLNVNKPVANLKPDSASSTGLRAECKEACPSGERAHGVSCVPTVAYPVFGPGDPGAGDAAANHQANCDLFGGTYSDDNVTGGQCAGLDDQNASCRHVNPSGAADCGPYFDTMRTCLNVNRPVKSLNPDAASSTGFRAECKEACPSGERARGTSCASAGVSARGRALEVEVFPRAALEHVKESPKPKTSSPAPPQGGAPSLLSV